LNIKTMMHRINRGIVLAAVLLIGLVSYLIVDSIMFSNERVEIKAMVAEYANLAEQLMILPESAQKPGQPALDDEVQAKIEESKFKLGQYLTSSVSNRDISAFERVTMSLEHSFKSNQNLCAYVLECEFAIIDVKGLKKHGTNTATGDIVVKTTIKTIGSPDYIKLLWQQNVTDNHGYFSGTKDGGEEYGPETIDTEIHTMSNTVSFDDVVFKKVDGKWKIASTSQMSFMSDIATMGEGY